MNLMSRIFKKNERGFLHIPLLIAVALMAALAGVYAFGSQSSGDKTSQRVGKVNASALIQSANNLKTGIDTMLIEGNRLDELALDNCDQGAAPCTNISANTIGLYNPSKGSMEEPGYPPEAVDPDNTNGWQIDRAVDITGTSGSVGVSGNGEGVVWIDYVKSGICDSINEILHSTEEIPGTSGATVTAPFPALTDESTSTAGSAESWAFAGTPNNPWKSGCVNDGTSNVFFHTVDVN